MFRSPSAKATTSFAAAFTATYIAGTARRCHGTEAPTTRIAHTKGGTFTTSIHIHRLN